MKRFLLLLALVALLVPTQAVWDNTSANTRLVYNLTALSGVSTTNQLLHLTLQNTTGGTYPYINENLATAQMNVSPYIIYGNGTSYPAYQTSTGACSYWESFGVTIGSVKYYSLWVNVPSMAGSSSANNTQIALYTNASFSGSMLGGSQSDSYNSTCVFREIEAAYLFEGSTKISPYGENSNHNKANATVASANLTTVNQTVGTRSPIWAGSTSYMNLSTVGNNTAVILLVQGRISTAPTGSLYTLYDQGGGNIYMRDNGCYSPDTGGLTTPVANLKNDTVYSWTCLFNQSMGSTTNDYSFFSNGLRNATGSQSSAITTMPYYINTGVGTTGFPGYLSSVLVVDGGTKSQLGGGWTMNVYDAITQYSSTEQQPSSTTAITLYAPTNGLNVYNATNTPLNFTGSSATNGTSVMVYQTLNGVTRFNAYTANGTNTLTTLTGLRVGSNTISLIMDDASGNTTSSSATFTLYNGLNITISNNTQGGTTFANYYLNVSNSTNSTLNAAPTNPYFFDSRTIPSDTNGLAVNLTVWKSGYANQTFLISNSSNQSIFAYNVTLWRVQEFKAVDAVTNASLSSFNLTFWGTGANNTQYTTTNGTIQVSLGSIPAGNYTLTYTIANYNTTNYTFDANATSEVNYTAQIYRAGLTIYAFDEASCLSNCSMIYFSWAATNGTSTNNSFNVAPLHQVTLQSTDLPTNTVTLTFNNTVNGSYYPRSYYVTVSSTTASILNVYLLNSSSSTISATYCTVNSGNQAIANATLTFQRLNGTSYVTVAQGTTGSTGCFTLYLDSTMAYQVIASATGYNTGTFTAQPVTLQTITLSSTTTNLGFQISYGDALDQVLTKLQPYQTGLTGSSQIVNFTVYSYNATLTKWGMTCEYNNNTIYSVNQTGSPSGGSTTSNISLTNKTSPNYFDCYGLFDRSGYNTTYVSRRFYVFAPNTTYANTSASGLVGQINNGQFSTETLFIASIVLTTVGTAGLTSAAAGVGAPLGAGIISLALLTGFAFLGWINAGWVILYAIVTLAFSYFNSRQF